MVQVWRIGRPERWLCDIEFRVDSTRLPGRQRYASIIRGEFATATVPQGDPVFDGPGLLGMVFHFGTNSNPGAGLAGR